MNNNIPTELIAEFATIADRMEQAIRKDERRKVREQLLQRLHETDPQRRGVGERGKDRRGFRPTISRECGMTEKAVRNAVFRLRQGGYSIACDRVGYVRPKYRLAS